MSESKDAELPLDDVLQIMDVAAALSEQRERAQRELPLAEVKEPLQEQLLRDAERAGEPMTQEDVEASIQRYFDYLHSFEEPQPGLTTLAAHLYIRRTWLLLLGGALLAFGGGAWWLMRSWG